MNRMPRWAFWSIALLLLVTTSCYGAKSTKLKIGDAAPDWNGLVGTDDARHGLSDYKSAPIVVVVFTCNHCPVAKAYEERLVALQRDYRDKKVRLVAINVNKIPQDAPDKMKERARERGFNFPYLYDGTQQSGLAYGAAVTPHVFVLDKDRKIAYMGAVDDNMKADKVQARYLRDALDSLLAGKRPTIDNTDAVGCSIKYEKK
jgi:peroxiredoxin